MITRRKRRRVISLLYTSNYCCHTFSRSCEKSSKQSVRIRKSYYVIVSPSCCLATPLMKTAGSHISGRRISKRVLFQKVFLRFKSKMILPYAIASQFCSSRLIIPDLSIKKGFFSKKCKLKIHVLFST